PPHILRGQSPTPHDPHGAFPRSQAADRRRADDGPRRHHPGTDPGIAAGYEVAFWYGGHVDHPRHGRGGRDGTTRRGDVRRQGDRGGPRRAAVRPTAPSLYARLDPLHSTHGSGPCQQEPARNHRWGRAEPFAPPTRLSFCGALPTRNGEVPGGKPAPLGGGAGPQGRLRARTTRGGAMTEPLLRVKDLVKHFAITGGVLSREVDR